MRFMDRLSSLLCPRLSLNNSISRLSISKIRHQLISSIHHSSTVIHSSISMFSNNSPSSSIGILTQVSITGQPHLNHSIRLFLLRPLLQYSQSLLLTLTCHLMSSSLSTSRDKFSWHRHPLLSSLFLSQCLPRVKRVRCTRLHSKCNLYKLKISRTRKRRRSLSREQRIIEQLSILRSQHKVRMHTMIKRALIIRVGSSRT